MKTYDGVFLGKQLTAKKRGLFLQKGSIIDLRLGSKYASYIDVFSYFQTCIFSLHIPEYSSCHGSSKNRVARTFNLHCTAVQGRFADAFLYFWGDKGYILNQRGLCSNVIQSRLIVCGDTVPSSQTSFLKIKIFLEKGVRTWESGEQSLDKIQLIYTQ